jgi:pSer/pThr/pTyr-binding forkhead associated (FHA) protein/outer membrane protein assembly factor BamB
MFRLTSSHPDIQSVDLTAPRTSIGKHDSNALIVAGEHISDFHAEFHSDGELAFIIDLGSESGTLLNGSAVEKRTQLQDGDRINIDDIEITVQDMSLPPEEDAAIQTEEWKLVAATELVEFEACVIEGVITVGREKTCGLCVPSTHISRSHAELEVVDGVLNIKDLGSANGTFVNDSKITATVLKDGDRVRFDTAEFVVLGPKPVVEEDSSKTQIRMVADMDMAEPAAPTDEAVPAEVVDPGTSNPATTSAEAEQKTAEQELDEITNLDPDDAKLDFDISDFEDDAKAVAAKPPEKAGEAVVEDSAEDKVEDKAEDKIEDDFAAMSAGKTTFGDAWKDADADEVSDRTMAMPSINGDSTIDANGTMIMSASFPTLECQTEPLAGKTFSLVNNPTKIGRAANNDIAINEASVSSLHAEISHRDGKWIIEDKGSYNGVFINRKKCQTGVISSGDVIGIGRVQLVFDDPEASASSGSALLGKAASAVRLPAKVTIPLAVIVLLIVAGYFIWPLLQFGGLEVEQYWAEGAGDRQSPATPVIQDMNRDGVQDILVTDESGRVDIISGNNGFRLTQIKTASPIKSAPMRIDVGSDGKVDVVVASSSGVVQAYSSDGKTLWRNDKLQGESSILNQPVTARINNDAVDDIILSTAENGVVALDGNSGVMLWNTKNDVAGKVVTRPLVADINRDGMLDIIVITDTNELIVFTTSGDQVRKTWSQAVPPVLIATPVYAINNDAVGFIAVATQSNGVIAFNSQTGNRLWQTPVAGLIFADPVAVDLDNDNKADAVNVITLEGKLLSLDASSGDINWSKQLDAGVQATPLVVDVNGDTQNDLVIADTAGRLLMLDAEDGSIILNTSIPNADRFVVSPVIGDINNDGYADIILVSQNGKLFAYKLTAIAM